MNRIEELEKELKLLREIEELKNKPKYEVGKWYKTNTFLVFIERFKTPKQANVYGLHKGNWLTSNSFFIGEFEAFTEATNEEVQTALIKEAKKRGFKEGVRFQSAWDSVEYIFNKIGTYRDRHPHPSLVAEPLGAIFCKGKWATIIDTPLTINGKTVTIGKEFVSIGCKTLEHKAFKQFVSDLTFFNITDFNHPEVGNVTTKQFQEIVDKIE